MKYFLISLLLFLPIATQAQEGQIVKIEFQSLSRSYFELVSITSDSVISKQNENRTSKEKTERRTISNKEWKMLLKDLGTIKLDQIPVLESPTSKRTYDGARHSSIKITTTSNSYEHLFDDENPNASLSQLMRCIAQIRDKE